jgi:uncharacterized protein CbrC (UPF0167 family)
MEERDKKNDEETNKLNDLRYWEKVLDRDDLVRTYTKTPKTTRKRRNCLRCGHSFESQGTYTCARCQKINQRQGAFGEYII